MVNCSRVARNFRPSQMMAGQSYNYYIIIINLEKDVRITKQLVNRVPGHLWSNQFVLPCAAKQHGFEVVPKALFSHKLCEDREPV
jgi:hypothetical protein